MKFRSFSVGMTFLLLGHTSSLAYAQRTFAARVVQNGAINEALTRDLSISMTQRSWGNEAPFENVGSLVGSIDYWQSFWDRIADRVENYLGKAPVEIKDHFMDTYLNKLEENRDTIIKSASLPFVD